MTHCLFNFLGSVAANRCGTDARRAVAMRWRHTASMLGLLGVVPIALHAQAPQATTGAMPSAVAGTVVVMASTTSTEQSGLFAHLLPLLKKDTGIEVKVVALGTGQALDMARRGDADLVFVHDTAAEEKFVAEGWGLKRWPVMHNDFVLVGPKADPAQARGKDIAQALSQIARHNAPWVSRGDKSGTHAAELRYWAAGSAPPAAAPGTESRNKNTGRGSGYRECGCGMGPALNMAAALDAYVLADRGTWLNFKNRADLAILVEGDPRLFNPYGVIAVNPVRHPHVKAEAADRVIRWLTNSPGQNAIATYKINGQTVFFPNAQAKP